MESNNQRYENGQMIGALAGAGGGAGAGKEEHITSEQDINLREQAN
jgi:hypothetical protein